MVQGLKCTGDNFANLVRSVIVMSKFLREAFPGFGRINPTFGLDNVVTGAVCLSYCIFMRCWAIWVLDSISFYDSSRLDTMQAPNLATELDTFELSNNKVNGRRSSRP